MKHYIRILGFCVMVPFVAAADSIKPTYDRTAFQQLMRQKLAHMQGVHEGVLTENWDMITKHLDGLKEVGETATWKMIRTDGYQTHSARFHGAVADLRDAVKRQDSEAALAPYIRLTMSCVECHNHVRSRIR